MENYTLGFVDEFVVDGAGKAFGELDWGNKPCGNHSIRCKIGVLAKLFYTDRTDGKFFPENQC